MNDMGALTILIIRHAEKPKENWPGPGLTDTGAMDSKSLVIRGWQRAGAWTALFAAGLGGSDYPRPDAVYAAQPGDAGDDDDGPSKRPMETVSALSPRLNGIDTNTHYAQGQEKQLMVEVLTLSGTVLISWEHKAIISAILPEIPAHGALPTKWPGDRFDVVLRFDRTGDATKFTYRELYPRLLSGDNNTPLPNAPQLTTTRS
jgi:hypothetical protein